MPIDATDIQVRRAGAAGLGGAISAVAAGAAPFDDVQPSESANGKIEYRCEYVRNNDATRTLEAATLWLSANTPSTSTIIEVGLGTSAENGVEQTIANEATAPAGVVFSTAASKAAGLLLGDLGPGETRAVWYRRTVAAGAPALNPDTYTRSVEGMSL